MNQGYRFETTRQKKRKARIKRFVSWLKFILILGLTVSSLVFAALSPLFEIKSIQVTGMRHYKQDEIIRISGLKTGENGFKTIGSSPETILLLRFGKAEEALRQACPYIKSVRAKFVLPSRIAIDLVEREPVALVPYNGTSLLIDREGYVLEAAGEGNPGAFLQVKGLKFENYRLGGKLALKDETVMDRVARILQAIQISDKNEQPPIAGKIKAMDVTDASKAFLFIDGRLTVNLGDLQDLNYRIGVVKLILNKSMKKGEKGLLDFTKGKDPVFTPENKGE